MRVNHSRRRRMMGVCALWYTKRLSEATSRQVLRLMITSSPSGRMVVASLPSSLSRQAKPSDDSASALMRSRLSTKSLSSGLSSGALSCATFSSAMW